MKKPKRRNHLLVSRRFKTACGKRNTYALDWTIDPDFVTCEACKKAAKLPPF